MPILLAFLLLVLVIHCGSLEPICLCALMDSEWKGAGEQGLGVIVSMTVSATQEIVPGSVHILNSGGQQGSSATA